MDIALGAALLWANEKKEKMMSYPTTKGRIPLPKRIARHCLECSGAAKEVSLCQIFDCNLWPVRFGYTQKDGRYNERMKIAMKRWPDDVDEIKKMGIDIERFFYKKPPGRKKGVGS